ncbi:hypothetical protein VDBG_10223 [Verticillium alfalfae VaMs.102]|uniref:Uncharacterized protein n=1 Tax=Verticillium alfalfae (strain VaMs.102 / ATCC MYA-4576 / FGSC 10136) TaxID=526221 RepID=C9SZ98_VERA1|nr:hypothetical protein VDBG_10223 [Verticillium alfalfae VaMs.102]EEY24113.1 hypothetical protein VDBG_10223 [Verticillium alfalfae VaMs.102]
MASSAWRSAQCVWARATNGSMHITGVIYAGE